MVKAIKHNIKAWLFSLLFNDDDYRIIFRALVNQLERDKMDDCMIDYRVSFTNDYSLQEQTIEKVEKLNSKLKLKIEWKLKAN